MEKEKLKVKVAEQLALFDQPNTAETLIKYTSFSQEIGYAVDLKVFEQKRPNDVDWFKKKMYSVLEPERQEIVEEFLKQLTVETAQKFYNKRSFLYEVVQMKIFDFPHKAIMEILRNYHKYISWCLFEAAQIRLVETLTAQEIKTLREEIKFQFRLSEAAQLKAFEIYSKDDFAIILSISPDWQVNVFQKITPYLNKTGMKELLLALIEHKGEICDEMQRRFLVTLPKEDTKEIFLKHLEKIGYLGDETKVKILTDFPKEDALEIMRASAQTEKVIDEEVLLRIMDIFDANIVCEIFSKYIGNGVEFPVETQLNMVEVLPKDTGKELLRQYQKRGGKLCKEAKVFLSRK